MNHLPAIVMLSLLLLGVVGTGCTRKPAPYAGPTAVVDAASDAQVDSTLHDNHWVVLDFGADWCYPCQVAKPKVAALSLQFKDQIRFLGVDIDKLDKIAERYSVRAIPALLLFHDGTLVTKLDDTAPQAELAAQLTRHLAPPAAP